MPREPLLVYVNGDFVPADRAKISVFDHSFLYGDGVFEGVRVQGRRVIQLGQHVARLYRSAHYLQIAIPILPDDFTAAILETVRVNGLEDGYLRPLVSRGEGSMGIEATRSLGRPNVLVIPQLRRKFDERIRTEVGLTAAVVPIRRTPPECVDPRIKANHYLNNILGKLAQWSAGADVGLMLDMRGYLAEGSSENVFVARGGVISTPHFQTSLDGITRGAVIEALRHAGRHVEEADLTTYDLYTADEVFVCGTLTEIAPLVRIDGRQIGSGRPGPVSRQALELLRAALEADSVPVY